LAGRARKVLKKGMCVDLTYATTATTTTKMDKAVKEKTK